MLQIEEYPCANGNEAKARERYWIEELNAKLNIAIPNRSKSEWYEQNKDKISQQQKEYKQINKDKIKQHHAEYMASHSVEVGYRVCGHRLFFAMPMQWQNYIFILIIFYFLIKKFHR